MRRISGTWNRVATIRNSRRASRLTNSLIGCRVRAPEAVDLGKESDATKKLYGIGERRDGRFRSQVPARSAAGGAWSSFRATLLGHEYRRRLGRCSHGSRRSHTKMCEKTDLPIAGLLTDLKARGLLDSTLVVWSSEFGRTPLAEGRTGAIIILMRSACGWRARDQRWTGSRGER